MNIFFCFLGFYKIVYVAFNKLHNYLKPGLSISHHPHDHSSENVTRIMNSRVIGVSLDKSGNVKLNQPVVITLKHLIVSIFMLIRIQFTRQYYFFTL